MSNGMSDGTSRQWGKLEPEHARLEELLSAYADGELPSSEMAEVNAHLRECARCRRQLELSAAMDEALANEPIAAASPAFRDRTLARTRAYPAPRASSDGLHQIGDRARAWPAWERRLAWSGWAVAAGLAALLVIGGPLVDARSGTPGDATIAERTSAVDAHATAPITAPVTGPAIPMVAAAVADFDNTMSSALPGSASDLDAVRAVLPFAVTPLRSPDVRLLAAWTTTIRGAPSAALAYRWRDRIIVQYVVPASLFDRQPDVQRAVAGGGVFTATEDGRGVVAWPDAGSGSLLVGGVAPGELLHARGAGAL